MNEHNYWTSIVDVAVVAFKGYTIKEKSLAKSSKAVS